MKQKNINFLFAFLLLISFSSNTFAFLLPPETILQNNVSQRSFLKSIIIQHQIQFLEGFYSPKAFSCKETLYFVTTGLFRADYLCDSIPYSFIRNTKERKTIYNKLITQLEFSPLNFWPGLFLTTQADNLIQSLSHHQFISAEEQMINDKKAWSIDASVSLVRLGKIEKSTPEKLERNVTLLVSGDSGKIWFEKDLFLPQKIEYEGKTLLFKQYKDYPFNAVRKLSFKYPQKIEIQESEIAGVLIETKDIQLNPSLDAALFNSALVSKKINMAFSDENQTHKEVLEQFIFEYR